MNQVSDDLIIKLAKHIANSVSGVSVIEQNRDPETRKFEIKVNLRSNFGFNYFIKLAEYTWTEKGPVFDFSISGSKLAIEVMEAIKNFNPNL